MYLRAWICWTSNCLAWLKCNVRTKHLNSGVLCCRVLFFWWDELPSSVVFFARRTVPRLGEAGGLEVLENPPEKRSLPIRVPLYYEEGSSTHTRVQDLSCRVIGLSNAVCPWRLASCPVIDRRGGTSVVLICNLVHFLLFLFFSPFCPNCSRQVKTSMLEFLVYWLKTKTRRSSFSLANSGFSDWSVETNEKELKKYPWTPSWFSRQTDQLRQTLLVMNTSTNTI